LAAARNGRGELPMGRRFCVAFLFACVLLTPDLARAATPIDGKSLTWHWALPFAGLLLTIAVAPLLFPRIWHGHYAKFAYMFCVFTLVPMAALAGIPLAVTTLVYALLADYLSFIVLLFALYVVAGGILVSGNLRGTPLFNALLLVFGTLIASVIGTTGAAIVLIRPLLRANINRLHNAHVIVFFIILVCNVGGALSPLGDPPLFIGFLRGVDFFWPAQHLWFETAIVAGIVLVIFIALDAWLYRQDRKVELIGEESPPVGLGLHGSINLLLLAAIIAVIMLTAAWKPNVTFTVYETSLALADLVRNTLLIIIALLSLVLTHEEHREANGFTWGPMREVAILFGAIFICIVPVISMLQAGKEGAFAWLHTFLSPEGVPSNIGYFWLSGLLSALLDNVPVYGLLFEVAGGDAALLMGPFAGTLAAISMGTVYMGALSYIGNAPNYMVYAVALERGIRMPSFFGYMVWSIVVLVPIMILITYVSVARL
jgi:Na+/H+ antiporter NhaD/arsenite permease-like protein